MGQTRPESYQAAFFPQIVVDELGGSGLHAALVLRPARALRFEKKSVAEQRD